MGTVQILLENGSKILSIRSQRLHLLSQELQYMLTFPIINPARDKKGVGEER